MTRVDNKIRLTTCVLVSTKYPLEGGQRRDQWRGTRLRSHTVYQDFAAKRKNRKILVQLANVGVFPVTDHLHNQHLHHAHPPALLFPLPHTRVHQPRQGQRRLLYGQSIGSSRSRSLGREVG
jgi:hypothetical protein